jgi:hypothetical protein
MTEPQAPTPTEATPYSPGGDMTAGVARAHIETPEEIAANPIDDPPARNCEACFGSGADLDDPCTVTESGEHVFDLTEADAEALRPQDVEAHEAIDAALYEQPGDPYSSQHAKVLRFEISVGKDDDEHTVEEFEKAVRTALTFARDHAASVFKSGQQELRWHNLTTMGAYYIIDGKVCVPADYNRRTKNRKPGTVPPPWAGGPAKGKESEYLNSLAHADDEPAPAPVSVQPGKPAKRKRATRREEVTPTDSPEDAVAKLAGNMTREVTEQ